jgi:hypothetical protein
MAELRGTAVVDEHVASMLVKVLISKMGRGRSGHGRSADSQKKKTKRLLAGLAWPMKPGPIA